MDVRTGDSNAITRQYFDSLLLQMRHIDSKKPVTGMTLYGERFSTPVMTAALSHLDKVRENGMVELAEGARRAGAVNWAGMGPEAELEAITATGARTIKIIKPYADNDRCFRKIEHAVGCSCLGVGMDLDHAFTVKGEHASVLGEDMAPKSLDEIKTFVAACPCPFIIKGVLSLDDTRKCLEAGVQGIVVSHHHGIMRSVVPPLMILPEILEIVKGKMPVFVDCGFESGMDVFKALALGATAVSIGRLIMKPLGENGAEGVKDRIEDITGQLAGAMARTGCADPAHIDSSVLVRNSDGMT